MEVPRLSPPTPTPRSYVEVGPSVVERRRIESAASLARPLEELTHVQRRALLEEEASRAAAREAAEARAEADAAADRLAEAKEKQKTLQTTPLVPLRLGGEVPPRRRIVPKQVDLSYLEKREKLRPQAVDFAIPDATPLARVRVPLLPVPVADLLPTLDNSQLI
mmetsp:Transcript_15291/g.50023  ORF Transcript_15291/g.50023 Transcript_15291/m.50023 type:complete len:164 (-) Transcript_15291:28-519(-)